MKNHAKVSNERLEEVIISERERMKKARCIMIDYVKKEVIERIIELNID